MKLPKALAFKIPSLTLGKREMFLVTLFLLVSLGFLYNRFIWQPQWNNSKELRSEVEQQRQTLNLRISQGWNNITELKTKSQEIREQINKIYLTVPNIKNEPGLLVDFYNLSIHNLVQTQTIKFSEMKEVKDKNYSTFDVSLDVSGYNADIYNFIGDLENYTRINRISYIAFKPLNSIESTCSITVEFYALHEVQPDPQTYQFMKGTYGKAVPYRIFEAYVKEKQAESTDIPVPFAPTTDTSTTNTPTTGAPTTDTPTTGAHVPANEQLSLPKNEVSGKQNTMEPLPSSEAIKVNP